MEIITKGSYFAKKIKFECKTCGCVFLANETEYKPACSLAQMHDNIQYECECPCCGYIVYSYFM